MRYVQSLHGISNIEDCCESLVDIPSIVESATIEMGSKSIRRSLSDQFKKCFIDYEWEHDANLWFESGRDDTPHFFKNGVLAQVSWRHYGFIGTEMLRFQKDYLEERIETGVYICITNDLKRYVHSNDTLRRKTKPFAGSIRMNIVEDYIKKVSSIITVPLLVVGLLPP